MEGRDFKDLLLSQYVELLKRSITKANFQYLTAALSNSDEAAAAIQGKIPC